MDRNWVMALHKQNQIFQNCCFVFIRQMQNVHNRTVSQELCFARASHSKISRLIYISSMHRFDLKNIRVLKWHTHTDFPIFALLLLSDKCTHQKIIWDFVMIGWYFVRTTQGYFDHIEWWFRDCSKMTRKTYMMSE